LADMNDVRDELFRAAARVLGRQATQDEQSALIDAYNAAAGTIYDRCIISIESVSGVDLRKNPQLLEKSASVDRVRMALANLQAVAAQVKA